MNLPNCYLDGTPIETNETSLTKLAKPASEAWELVPMETASAYHETKTLSQAWIAEIELVSKL